MTQEPEPYTTVPRYIPNDYRQGKLNRNEWILYIWMRSTANMYGVGGVSIAVLHAEIFPDLKDKSSVNKMLLSLRKKKYVWFEDHQGSRSPFEVHFGDWLLPHKQIKTLDSFWKMEDGRSEYAPNTEQQTEDAQNPTIPNQKLKRAKEQLGEAFSFNAPLRAIRSAYNDTDKEKDKDKNDSLVKPSFKEILVRDFNPTNSEEARCHEIAIALKETNMNWILSGLKKYGLPAIEKSWGIYREDLARGKRIENPGAYFNGIVNTLVHE